MLSQSKPTFEKVSFPGVNGTTLAGTLDVPDGGARAWAVFCHGFTLGKNSAAASRISKALAGRGIGVLRYDAAGLGGSTGNWEDGSFSTKVADVRSAAEFMAASGRPVSLLIGHSLGGAAVLAAAGQIPGLKAVATIAAPFRPDHVVHMFEEELDEIVEQGSASVDLGGGELEIRRHLVEDLRKHELTDSIRELHLPLLVMHSPTDNTVGIDNASEIFSTARHPRNFISLEGSDHLMVERAQTSRAAAIIAAWAGIYLGLDES
ncbi:MULTISPECIES: alpha/beta hydrolase [unclassified Arthrobacter]|uniref:alpha/beta hydrolase n=1 Tax=unclassified Arthrobacter TaxID=235627 RepID=UPI001D1542C3|nr:MULTISPECIES: alpha/beta hydrolase [unclassified Arthrobacter]MCC3277321.1 alpha/beta hydrolase [Arthrobacter sp. zg-Y20]MCC9178175.1 alpha/beta hydrolase [Arthrobacter sp. zg-Y750]MDK1317481.1 alpha/beta hydrolase [Arthrobacter sp. zg.Y20]WIB07016.1 alpha/beta hydrolase [Arthrobacter sp. zg-Y20]